MQPAFANSSRDSGTPRTEPVVSPPVAPGRNRTEQAILVIAGARCDHEAQCRQLGPGRRHETRADCERSVSSEAYQDVQAVGCDQGVDPEKLEICLNEIRDEACDQPLDTLQRIMACSARPLCGA